MNPDSGEFKHAECDMTSAELRRLNIEDDIPIHRDNVSLLALPADHPARKTLIAHAVCRRDCACREINFLHPDSPGIEQEWKSATDGRLWKFSNFIYGYVCFSLILHGWLTHPLQLAEDELHGLEIIPKALTLLNECETAAANTKNHSILELIPYPRNFFLCWQEAINLRIKMDLQSQIAI